MNRGFQNRKVIAYLPSEQVGQRWHTNCCLLFKERCLLELLCDAFESQSSKQLLRTQMGKSHYESTAHIFLLDNFEP